MLSPAPDNETRLVRRTDDALVEFAERVALFGVVMKHVRIDAVLEGLTKGAAEAARHLVKDSASWPVAKRHARVSLDFGNRADQHDRLQALILESPPLMRLAIAAHMTPQQQARFPHLVGKDYRSLPAREAFAARLVREATR